jgi:hypothetical protein
MKIYKFSAKGDKMLLETDIIEEAEKILKEYRGKGCLIMDREGTQLDVSAPLPEEVYILWPMQGGNGH